MQREKLDAYIDSMQQEMLDSLSALIRIDSTRGQAQPGKPYGEGPAKVLEEAGRLMEKIGMKVTDYDHYVIAGDYGEGEKVLDILAHLDVVPVTDKWTVTAPFEPKIVGDRIYGRGSADDKGPAVAALYAVKAIKDLGIPLKHSLRIVLGSDEECGSSDLEHYYAVEKEALYTFSPDADYPLINLEKGRVAAHVKASFKPAEGKQVVEFAGGDKVNVVPAECRMQVRGISLPEIREKADKVQEETGVKFSLETRAEDVCVTALGIAAHGAYPSDGNNAVTAMLQLVKVLDLDETDSTRALRAMADLFPHGDTAGKALGIAREDEISGALTMNLGVLNMNAEGMDAECDSRCPIGSTDENVTQVLQKQFADHGLTMEDTQMSPVHYVPADSPIVQTLLESYETYFGKKGTPLYTGGGTYVHHLERGVAFGCMVPEVDNHMHGDDEFMEISMLMRSTKIFADAIIRLCEEA